MSYFYPLVASQNDSLEYLNTALTSKEFMVDTREDSSWKAFFVPSLVYMMLQKQYRSVRCEMGIDID